MSDSVAVRLYQLAQCADIPAERRRELLRLANELSGKIGKLNSRPEAEPFVDRYFSRPRPYPATRLLGPPRRRDVFGQEILL